MLKSLTKHSQIKKNDQKKIYELCLVLTENDVYMQMHVLNKSQ